MTDQDPAETAYHDQRDAAANELSNEVRRQLDPQGFRSKPGHGSIASRTAHARWDTWTEGAREQCKHIDLDGPQPMLLIAGVLYCYACGAKAKTVTPASNCDACGAGLALMHKRFDVLQQLGAVGFPLTLCPACAEES